MKFEDIKTETINFNNTTIEGFITKRIDEDHNEIMYFLNTKEIEKDDHQLYYDIDHNLNHVLIEHKYYQHIEDLMKVIENGEEHILTHEEYLLDTVQ